MIYHFKIWDDRTEALGKVFQGKPHRTARTVFLEIKSLGPIDFYENSQMVEFSGLENTTFELYPRFMDNDYRYYRYDFDSRRHFPKNFLLTGSLDNVEEFTEYLMHSIKDYFLLKIDEVKDNA